MAPSASSDSAIAGVTADGKRAAPPSSEERPAKVPTITHPWDGSLPSDDAAEDAMLTMRHIIPEVVTKLPEALASWAGSSNSHVISANLYEVQPLAIKESVAEGELATFKAPWQTSQCLQSVETTGLYEAAVNVTWLDAQKKLKLPFDFPMERPGWSTVHEIYERQFSKHASGLGGVTPGGPTRLYFPIPIPCFVTDGKILENKCFNEGLMLAGGHGLVYGWYLGMWKALQTKDDAYIKRLWECGLTVTVRVRKICGVDPRPIILDSLNYSEACQVAKLSNTDSFRVFAWKLHSFTKVHKQEAPKATQDAIIKHLVQQGVRFKGSAMNATMFKMAKGLFDACDDKVRDEMEQLEWKYGPDLLSSSYNKIGRLVQSCQKAAATSKDIEMETALVFVLQMMDYCVSTGQARSAKFFTMDVVDKQKDGSQGWFGMTLNKMKFFTYFQTTFVDSLKQNNEALWNTLTTDVLPNFVSPKPAVQVALAAADGEGSAGMTATKLNPVALQVHDLLLSVYQGEFDSCFKRANLEQAMRETFASCGETSDNFLKPLRDGVVSLQRCAATMAVVPGGSGPQVEKETGNKKKRTLERTDSCISVGDETDVRSELQRKCTLERMKYVQFVTIAKLSKKNLEDAYTSSGVRQIQTAKDAHRGFFFSADLIVEHAKEPWLRPQYPVQTTLKEITDWSKEVKGAHDWLFFFDGRSREVNSQITALMKGRQHLNELMLLFTATGTARETTRTRKVALSSKNVEGLMLYPPCARTALTAKPRNAFNVLGESSTYDTTYSGITFRTLRSLPRISEQDKALIHEGSPSSVPDELLQAFPNPVLFWQESKPVDLYEQLLVDFDIRGIFDISPGSGALAEAALRLGVCYVGVTTKTTHAKWLGNVVDRVAMSHMAAPGRPCYQKDLATEVQTHFGDMLAGLEESADMEDIDVAKLLPNVE
jgi:hypothetical protein